MTAEERDFCRQIFDLYSHQESGGSLSSSSSSVGGLSSSGGCGRGDADAAELTQLYVLPRAIKLFGKRAGSVRSVQIALLACGIRAAFVDSSFCYDEMSKGNAQKVRAFEFVQFVQQVLPFVGFSMTPTSFKSNGTCRPCEPVWYDQRRVGWRDVHRLHLPDEYEQDIYRGTMRGDVAPLSRDTLEMLPYVSVYFNLRIASDECNLTEMWSEELVSEFVPQCLKNAERVLADKRARLECIAQAVLTRETCSVVLVYGASGVKENC